MGHDNDENNQNGDQSHTPNSPNKYPLLNINTRKYDWASRTFQKMEGTLGLNIKTHGADVRKTLEDGQIFLFNHFVRFETIIPPYIIHREIGAYTRSVADKGLFTGGGALAKLLREVGAVPNDLPGLLPFLAAEILRGKKVVIFPEGGMIKDRRILDDAGELGIFSQKQNVFRKHHRGAAVLSLTLELFKRRILTNFKKGDEARIEHWQKSLGLTRDALYQAATKPTLIVPGGITFYPIHIDDNILRRGLSLFVKNPSVRMLEEVLIETNILFKKTDMDIKLGDPVSAHHSWHWWEKLLLSRYFRHIHSLDDFFNMRETADRWTEKLLVKLMSRETDRIRDAYMEGIYANVMVNLAHLASTLLLHLARQGYAQISLKDFHKALYLALKDLHNCPNVPLHRSLCWPDRYAGLLEDKCADLDRFIKTCEHAGLLEVNSTHYNINDALTQEVDYHKVRLNNPVQVNNNEVAHFKEVKEAVVDACNQVSEKKVSRTAMAEMLFDDEMRAYRWNRQHYWRQKYADINNKETATQSGAPYLLVNDADSTAEKRIGVLIVHGFMSSPASLKSYGEKLHKKGYSVMGMRLAGHGTSPHDANERSAEDWLASVRRSYRILSAFVDEVVVVGFSTGGAVSLVFSKEKPPGLAGLVSVAAPIKVQDRKIALVPLIHRLNKVADWIPGLDGVHQFTNNDTTRPDINYQSTPIRSLYELRQVMAHLRRNLKNIETPTLVLQGTDDDVVRPSSATTIYKLLGSRDKRIEWIKTSEHNLIAKNIAETHNLIEAFIDDVTGVKVLEEPDGTLANDTLTDAKKMKPEKNDPTEKE